MAQEPAREERTLIKEMMTRARTAQSRVENWTQEDLNRLSQAIA